MRNPDPGIAVADLTVRYGGAVAVDGVSLQAGHGELTGLIGPNGAGKTTTFNACSGLQRPSSGSVLLFGEDVTRLNAAARARRGLGRTFQKMELISSMTVAENVSVGCEARLAGRSPLRQLVETRAERVTAAESVEEAVELCGLTSVMHRRVGALSTGQRRLVELARARAAGFQQLLLDEPSSGLDQRETERVAAIIVRMVETDGIGVLLVEHDMSLVMSVCTYVYVLDFGKLIFEGTPSNVMSSEIVQAAYLGSQEGLASAGVAS